MANALCNFRFVRCALNKIAVLNRFSQVRNIMTSEFRSAEAVEELKRNPYYEKYSKKIAVLQETSPDEFLSRLKEKHEKENKQTKPDDEAKPATYSAKPGNTIPINKAFTKPKELNDVFKIDLIKDKTKDEIVQIWLEYHKTKDAIAASVPNQTYELFMSRGSKYPAFLLPLPRNQGYEFVVCQFNANEVHFTPLIAYQTHKENAPECLTMIFYTDLIDSKDLILMKGEFDKNVLNAMEAQCLANQLQIFYGENNEKRTKLLDRFTYEPESFKHMDLIAEFECLSF